MTEASIFPSYAQYQIRSQTGQTYKIKMSSQTSILPPEMVEKIIQNFTSIQDVGNFSIALVGTRYEEFFEASTKNICFFGSRFEKKSEK